MKKIVKYMFIFCMMFSIVGCATNKEEAAKEDEIEEKEKKKEQKKESKEENKKEEDEKAWEKYAQKNKEQQKNQSGESYSQDTQEVEEGLESEEETEEPAQELLEDDDTFVYMPEEDKIFASYEEALAYGNKNAWDMHEKYGKAVRYGTSKNEADEIVLSWYIKE